MLIWSLTTINISVAGLNRLLQTEGLSGSSQENGTKTNRRLLEQDPQLPIQLKKSIMAYPLIYMTNLATIFFQHNVQNVWNQVNGT